MCLQEWKQKHETSGRTNIQSQYVPPSEEQTQKHTQPPEMSTIYEENMKVQQNMEHGKQRPIKEEQYFHQLQTSGETKSYEETRNHRHQGGVSSETQHQP